MKKVSRLFKTVVIILLWGLLVLNQFPITITPQIAQAGPLAQTAGVTLSLPSPIFIGSAFSFTATFDASGATGYGPFIDLIFPVNGADGAAATGTPDGIDFDSASYLGSSVTVEEVIFPDDGIGCVDHPYAVDTTHTPIQVCGTPGDKLVVIQLPFGSFTPDQPPAEIAINASISPLADLGEPLPIRSRGGFQYGKDALDNWCCDPVILTNPNPDSSTWTPDYTTPQLMTLTKTNDGRESETATGPNYLPQYTITVEVASGQAITNLDITDYIDDNIIVTGVSDFSPAGSVISLGGGVPTVPYGPVNSVSPANELVVRFPSVTGTASFNVEFYVPDLNAAGNPVLDPDTGTSTTTENYATARATWLPVDPRDPPTTITVEDPCPGCHNTLTDRSIAIQKSVEEVSGNPIRSGVTLEYTLDFQISDYFTFENITITDVLSDGQRVDKTSPPTFSVSDLNGTVTGAMDFASNVVVDESQIGNDINPATNGSTTITFNVSQALSDLGAVDGRLEGGRVSGTNGAARGQITFLVDVLDAFTDTYLSGDPSVDHGDILTNDATITGAVIDNNTGLPTGGNPTDNTHSEVTISQGTLTKSLYAVNGAAPTGSPALIAPGDTVTYRLMYHMPSSDFEEFTITDYLPLPIFSAAEITVFDDVRNATAPPAGHAHFGPGDTFRANCQAATGELNCLKSVNSPTGSPIPGLTIDSGSNSVEFFYGDFDDPNNADTVIDILFTVTVRNDPFADGLFLTNQAHSHEGSTNAGDQDADGIVQVQLGEPVMMIRKGVTDSDNPDETFSTSTPQVPASPVGSDDLSNPDVANADIDGVDGSDIVEFAIVLQNSGRSGAFDLDIQDTLLPGFVIPAGGINLQIRRGDGTVLTSTPIGVAGPELSGLFGDGLRINPPVASAPVCQKAHPADGTNTVVITYELQIDPNVAPGTVIPNTASLLNYAGTPGGPNHLDDGEGGVQPITDDASTTIAQPTITKAPGAATVAVGQTFDYTLTMTIPEGQMASMQVVDDLSDGQAFVRCASITPSTSDLSSSLGFANVCSNPVVDAGGGRVTFDFGTLTNTNTNNGTDETLTIVYTVVPLNLTTVQSGTDLTNNVTLNWTGGSVNTSAVVVDVVEPALSVTKSSNVITGDAGDSITYTILIQHTAASNATAYDVVLQDTLPAGLSYGGSVGVGTCNDAPDIGPAQAGGIISATWNDFPVGRSCAITFTAELTGDVSPGQVITNTAEITWTSVSGPAAGNNTYNPNGVERTGDSANSGEDNDYNETNSTNVTVANPVLTKTIVQTSEAHTGETTPRPVAVGEIVRYRLTMEVPEGTSPTVQLRDTLPTGLQFLNDNTAKIAFVSNTGLTSSTLTPAATGCDGVGPNPALHFTGSAAVTPACPLPASAIQDGVPPTNFNQSDDPFFNLGTLTNADRNDSNVEYVIVEFNALVVNITQNSLGINRDNSFAAWINNINRGTSGSVRVRITEPQFVITKGATPTQGDAGDSISFTLTITNPAGADRTTGFEAHITDPLPADYTLDLTSVSGVGSGGIVGLTNNSAGNTIDYTLTTFPVGGQVTINYTATLKNTVTPGQTLNNTATVTWTSLPGPQGTTTNPTGSSTPGNSGAANGERDGSGAPLNDYTVSDTEAVNIDTPEPEKSIVATSEMHTDETADPRPLAIGEIVRYRLVTTLPEGTSNNVQLVDTMTNGLALVDNTQVKVSFIADDPLTTAADLSGADNDDDPPTFTLPTSYISTAGNVVTFSVGNLVNNDTDTDAEYIMVEFNALVTNSAATNLDDIKANIFTVRINGSDRGTSDPINAVIVEPFLTVTKAAAPLTGDAGDTISFTLTVTHTTTPPISNTTAYDVRIVDTLPGGYTLDSINPTLTGCGSSSVTDNSVGNTIDFTLSEVPLGCTVEIAYTATLNTSVMPGQALTNMATVTWTSLPGPRGTTSNPTGSSTPENSGLANGERDHQSGVNAANDYTDSDSETVTADDTFTLAKTATTPHTIGDLVTYTLTVDLIEGTTNNVVITDTLPNNIDFVNGPQTVTFGTAGASSTQSSFSFTDPTLTINLGNVTIPAGPDPNTVIVTFQARVMNSVVNANGNTKTNNATVTADGGLTASDSADTTLIEPALVIDKSITAPATIDAGDTLSYTISVYHTAGSTSDAFDVLITDILPADLTYAGNVQSVSGPAPTVDASGAPTITFSWATIPQSVTAASPYTFTFDVTLNNTVASGQTILNTADLRWDSQDGDGAPEERTYIGTDDASFTTGGTPTITKGITATSLIETGDGQHTLGITDLAVGETVTYQLTVTLIEGTDTIIVTDDLPDVLSVISSRVVSIGGNITGSLLNVGASGVHNDVNLVDGFSDQVIFNFGTVVNAADNVTDANDQIVVEVIARVEDVPANISTGTALINEGTLTHTTGTTSDSESIEIVEPLLEIEKTSTITAVDGGDTLTYTISVYHAAGSTSDAFDVTLTDVLPAEVTYAGNVQSISGPAPTVDASGAPTITFSWTTIPLSASPYSFTFDVTVADTVTTGQHITNAVSMTYDNLPNTGGRSDTDSDDHTVAVGSAFALTKEATTPHTIGDLVTYTLTMDLIEGTTNNVVIADTLPDNLDFVDGPQTITYGTTGTSTSQFLFMFIDPTLTINLGTVTIPVGAAPNTVIITFQARVMNDPVQNINGAVKTNSANATADGGLNASDTADTTITEPNLVIEKTLSPVYPSVGDTVTYTVSIYHSASSTADAFDVELTDVLPAELTYGGNVQLVNGVLPTVDASGAPTLLFGWDTIPLSVTAATPYSFSFEAEVNNTATMGQTITNTASMVYDSQNGDSAPEERSYSGTDSVDLTVPNINVTKTDALVIDNDGDGQVDPGDTIEYTVTLTNNGVTITNAVFDDTPDPHTALVVGSVAVSDPGAVVVTGNNPGDTAVSVNLNTFTSGATVIITFRVQVNSPLSNSITQIANQGEFSGDDTPSIPSDDDTPAPGDETITPVQGAPLIEASKVDALLIDLNGDGGASLGDTIEYTVSITNTGERDAENVVFTDTPDLNTTLVVGSVSSSDATAVIVTGNNPGDTAVRVEIPVIAAGTGTTTITFQVTINAPLNPPTTLQVANQGLVSGSNFTDEPTDDSDTPTDDDETITPLSPMPLIEASKVDVLLIDVSGNGQANPGDTLEYTIEIVNNGNGDANGVVFVDTPDPNTTLVVGSVTVSDPAATIAIGNNPGDNRMKVNIPLLPAGTAAQIRFQVTINNPLPDGVTQVSNQGTVRGNNFDNVVTDDTDTPEDDDTTDTPVGEHQDIQATKVDKLVVDVNGDGIVNPGDTLEYTVMLVNNGSAQATNVIFTDTPDANTTLIAGSVTVSKPTANIVTGNNPGDTNIMIELGHVQPGGRIRITFQVTINSPLPAGVTQVSNQGVFTGGNIEDTLTDDTDTTEAGDTTDTPIGSTAPGPDLVVTKVDSLLDDTPSGDGVPSPGDTLQYTITITNTGGAAAERVVFEDQPDVNTTLVIGSVTTTQGAVTIGNKAGDQSIRVIAEDILPGGVVTITFNVTINDPLNPPETNLIRNQGAIRGDNFVSQPTDDADTPESDDETLTVIGRIPYIDAAKSVKLTGDANSDGQATPGDTLTYTVIINNRGNVPAREIEFTDTPDPNTTLVIGSVTVSDPAATITQDTGVTVQIPRLAPGTSVEIKFDVRINDPLPAGVTQIANQGLVQGNNFTPVLTDDTGTPTDNDETRLDVDNPSAGEPAPEPLITVFDPSISKVGILEDGGVGLVGEKLTWTFTISNIGTGAGTDIVVSDTIDSVLRVDGAAIDQGSYTINGQTVTFFIPILNPGQTIYAYIYTTVLESPLDVDNTATLSGGGINRSASAHVTGISSLPSTGYAPDEPTGSRLPMILAGSLIVTAAGLAIWKRRRVYMTR